jgi:hypothetical protein
MHMKDCREQRHTQAMAPSVDELQLSRRLLHKICTRPRGPTKSFKSDGLTSKKIVNGIRLSPPLVAILIDNDNSTWFPYQAKAGCPTITEGGERGKRRSVWRRP